MYKIKNKLSPSLIQGIFLKHADLYNLRNERWWDANNIKTDNHGKETFAIRGPKTWEMLPSSIKESLSLNILK